MKFKDETIDDVIVIENCELNQFSNTLKNFLNEYDVVEIKYATNFKNSLQSTDKCLHNAILFVKRK